jgi:molecular chaperone DnaK
MMKEIAEEYLGSEVTDAVITVPAYFDDSQRQATKDAGKIAGLNVLRIINEPTAAALAFGLNKKKSGIDRCVSTWAVELSTFPSLKSMAMYSMLKQPAGTHFLGGEDFDIKIAEWLVQDYKNETGIDLQQLTAWRLQRLREATEKAKHELSSTLETEINLPFIASINGEPKHLTKKLTRAQLEILVEPLLERLIAPCQTALKDAGITVKQLNELILVGGMTRMPCVIEKAKEIFQKRTCKGCKSR